MASNAYPPPPLRASPVFVPLAILRIFATGLVGAVMFLLASAVPAPASAQQNPAPPEPGQCDLPPQTAPHASATPPAQGSASSGTEPGGAGSTGWTGGTGGSHIGTTPQAPTPGSPDRQPETVTGVDPTVEEPRRPC